MNLKETAEQNIINTYNRKPETPLFVKGEGAYVEDQEGNKYLDFLSGLGVNNVGHCHPRVVEAICRQAGALLHTSNLYYTEPQIRLARLLVEHTAFDQVFFSNSGAEANEGALKLARKYYQGRGEEKYEIISFHHSFHGRTMATVSVTGQEKYHQGFQPLLAGVRFAVFNDLEGVRALMTPKTCAVLVEPVQGEGGVYPAKVSFLQGLQKLCREQDVLLIFDEVQCGMGRTGKLFAYEHYGVVPDILTTAKSLGGGLPIGALLARRDVAEAFKPGDHASTFGGNPAACAAGCAVLEILTGGLLEQAVARGESLRQKLQQLESPLIAEVRGLGLMLAVEMREKGEEIFQSLTAAKILCNLIGGKILRILPPLIITEKEEELFLEALRKTLAEVAGEKGACC
jgi:acetylornithine/N-succinyldiaminopimelate aminotransferase